MKAGCSTDEAAAEGEHLHVMNTDVEEEVEVLFLINVEKASWYPSVCLN